MAYTVISDARRSFMNEDVKIMSTKSTGNEKTTIYLDPKIKKSVQYYALRDDSSLSQIINDMLYTYLEDMADIAAADESRNDGEEPIPFEQAIKELGLIIDGIQHRTQTEVSQTAQKVR
jgi:hypothetical protein